MDNPMTCPACGGSGGGPFGPPGSSWDVESYECPRCRSAGVVPRAGSREASLGRPLAKGSDLDRSAGEAPATADGPGVARAKPSAEERPTRRAASGRDA
jgi:hypothetical protein